MATTTLTTNLKLRISSDLTVDSKYNLQRLDSLGSIYQVDTNQVAKVRSQTDILIQPNDPDIGGGGSGGTVSVGTTDQPISVFRVFAGTVSLSASLSLADQAVGGDKTLNIGYKSDISGAVDTTADRSLLFDVDGADRTVVLGGDLNINETLTLVLTGATSITLPTSGTLASDSNTLTLTNKTLDAANNTFSNIANVHVSASAAIAGSKIDPSFAAQEVNSTTGFSSSAGVTFKLPSSDGAPSEVLVTDGSGQLSFASAATTSLLEDYVRIGNVSNEQQAVDTGSVGDIQANVTTGLTIKANTIVNADVNSAAAIALSKLATTTANRALQTGIGGAIEVATVTTSELGYLSGVTSAIQTQFGGKQDQDDELDAIAALTGTGIYVRLGAGSAALRSIAVGSVKLSVSNADGFSGNPTLDLGTVSTDDLTEGTALFFTDERAQDAVGGALTDSSTVDFTYNDVAGTITASTIDGAIDHDGLLNFAANEHIDHSVVNLNTNADSGLTGGGNITASRTLAVDITGTTAEASVASTDEILIYDITAGALRKATVSNITGATALGTFKDNWTQVDGSSVIITHNLGTLDVRAELYDTVDGATIVPDTLTRTSVNAVTITGVNLPGTFNFRVLVSEV